MARTLRATLQRRFCATMFGALTLIGLWAYAGVRHIVHRQLDGTLRTAGQTIVDVLSTHRTIAEHRDHVDGRRSLRAYNRLVVVRDSNGRILQANSPLARLLTVDAGSFRTALNGGPAWATSRLEGEPVRTVYLAAPPGAPVDAKVVQVAMSLIPLQQDLQSMILLMVITVVLASLATFAGSSWLARRALTPVADIAAQAKAVTGGRQPQRITAHADVVEFRRLIEVLNEMIGRLEDATVWHRRIIRDLAHDLRTPITALRAGVEVALWRERRPDEYRRTLGSAMEEIERLTLISDALVLLGRLESGDLEIARDTVELAEVAAGAVGRMQQRIGAHVFRFTRPMVAAPLIGDARLLGLALDQLLDNAKRHTPPGTLVEVSIQSSDDSIGLVVEDNGPGVSPELLPHLFERFFRADSARGRESGPGLGLTLVAAIIELHGGEVRAERVNGGGLRVRAELPRARQPAAPA
ncbi:MAG TPA: ATP-binding protein [Gemmatimonadales bacterium]|nr:ATP-binding protein [Gemmatimonadales bacterium]